MPKFSAPLIAVKNIEKSKDFYKSVLGMSVTLDLGQNVTMDDAIALQENFIDLMGLNKIELKHGGHDHELYFEEEDFDAFLNHLESFKELKYIHMDKEYPWGQRVVRFYDPDMHIIEVSESMDSVILRFHKEGLSAEEIAERSMHPLEYVKKHLSK